MKGHSVYSLSVLNALYHIHLNNKKAHPIYQLSVRSTIHLTHFTASYSSEQYKRTLFISTLCTHYYASYSTFCIIFTSTIRNHTQHIHSPCTLLCTIFTLLQHIHLTIRKHTRYINCLCRVLCILFALLCHIHLNNKKGHPYYSFSAHTTIHHIHFTASYSPQQYKSTHSISTLYAWYLPYCNIVLTLTIRKGTLYIHCLWIVLCILFTLEHHIHLNNKKNILYIHPPSVHVLCILFTLLRPRPSASSPILFYMK